MREGSYLERSRLAAARTLSEDAMGAFDPGALPHLLALTGPEIGAELLNRLSADLEAVGEGLVSALGPAEGAADWTALRAQSHVLIPIAGVVGADGLQAMAEGLNRRAAAAPTGKADCGPGLPELAANLLAALDALLAHIDGYDPARGPSLTAPGAAGR